MAYSFKISHLSVAFALVLMAVALFLALATPFNLFHLKQSETTQLKSVIIVSRHGEVSPNEESYFLGEEPPEELSSVIGQNQLTSIGKERMYLLGKFLKLRYYGPLLEGNPRKISIRSDNSDASLESGQSLLAGLNPPKSLNWIWSHDQELGSQWQPKAIYTTEALSDDLLSSESGCLKQDLYQGAWKNATAYLNALNEFRHDLQTLRQNTGLEFEDDLEMLTNIEEALKTRSAYSLNNYKSSSSSVSSSVGAPNWYTSTLANRLSHVANVVTGLRYKSSEMQQLIVGRLLHEILENVIDKIKSDLTANGAKIIASSPEMSHYAMDKERMQSSSSSSSSSGIVGLNTGKRQRVQRQVIEPNMFIYMTDKQHLSALLNSLQVYSQQPHYGSLLIIELHYDPVNQVHFLRLFTVDSPSHNILPEPVRVNPVFCHDTVECSPQKFENNMRNLALRKQVWQQICQERTQPSIIPSSISDTPPTVPLLPHDNGDSNVEPIVPPVQNLTDDTSPTTTTTATTTTTITTETPPQQSLIDEHSTSRPDTSESNSEEPRTNILEKLDENLIVGPTDWGSSSPLPPPQKPNNQQSTGEMQGKAPMSSNQQQQQQLDDQYQTTDKNDRLPSIDAELSTVIPSELPQTPPTNQTKDDRQPVELEIISDTRDGNREVEVASGSNVANESKNYEMELDDNTNDWEEKRQKALDSQQLSPADVVYGTY